MRAPRSTLLALLLTTLPACAATGTTRAAPSSALAPGQGARAWERLSRALPGGWRTTTEKGTILEIDYRLVSAGSVLLERYMPGTQYETASVYHRDGGDLVLTHYCAQGNQPRLRAARASDDEVVFRLHDATHAVRDRPILAELTVKLEGDALTQTAVYRQPDGTMERSSLRLLRAR
jgi:hypothetical protein